MICRALMGDAWVAMVGDGTRRSRRPRQVERVDLPVGPARDLRDAVYELYLRASSPPLTLDEVAALIAADEDLPGAPSGDVISGILSGRGLAANQDDVVSLAVLLARLADRDRVVIADRVRDLWVAAKMAPAALGPVRLGKPISECDPLLLEVHRAIEVAHHDRPLSSLPAYVPRAHDARLGNVVGAVAGGQSRLVTLVGGSSTGKTRACWEAVQPLAASGRWRLWHPKDPTRPGAAAAAISEVGGYTVLWLNEAQHYLLPADPTLGERVAAGLRSLLEDPHRGPVLVLATLWPQFWDRLTIRSSPDEPDLHAQARELLDGTDMRVPETFTADDLQTASTVGQDDPRIRQATERADAGRITQYLAGVPQLLRRYRNAPPVARAIIDVAIDARRLGHPPGVPHNLLAEAAPSYLTDHEWEQAGDDWLERALAYRRRSVTTQARRPCTGRQPTAVTPTRCGPLL